MMITLDDSPGGGFDVTERINGHVPKVITHHPMMHIAREDGIAEARQRGWPFESRVGTTQRRAEHAPAR